MPVGSLQFAPKVSYGTGPTVISMRFPQTAWEPASQGVGGSDVSGAGVVAAYEIRRDQILKTTLRFFESEWPAIGLWLEFGQRGNSFTFWMDQNDSTSSHVCYLLTPKMGDKIQLARHSEIVGAYTLDIELRDTSGTRFQYQALSL